MLENPPLGTPKRPRTFVPTYLFSMSNEDNNKHGTTRNWGLLYPNGSQVSPVDMIGKLTDLKFESLKSIRPFLTQLTLISLSINRPSPLTGIYPSHVPSYYSNSPTLVNYPMASPSDDNISFTSPKPYVHSNPHLTSPMPPYSPYPVSIRPPMFLLPIVNYRPPVCPILLNMHPICFFLQNLLLRFHLCHIHLQIQQFHTLPIPHKLLPTHLILPAHPLHHQVINYACGAGDDCKSIQLNGLCY